MTTENTIATVAAIVLVGLFLFLCLGRNAQTVYKYTPEECPEKGHEAHERPRSLPWRIYWHSSGEESVASARCALCGTSVPANTNVTLHP
jgi:ABC-type ATPase with predicted acetyltransferase domain